MNLRIKQICGLMMATSIVAACSQSLPNAEMPSRSSLQQKMETAKIDPRTNHYQGQIQVQLSTDKPLNEFVSEVYLEEGIALRALDEIKSQNIYLFEFDEKLDDSSVLKVLKSRSDVQRASANVHIQVRDFFHNDPFIGKQWSFSNAGQDAPNAVGGRHGADMDIHEVDQKGSKQVVVAIVDTGIDYLHEDLAVTEIVNGKRVVIEKQSNIWVNPGEIPGNGQNDDNNGGDVHGYTDDVHGYNFVEWHGDPMDDHGHGTHIAGVIGALRNNFKGIVGMNAEVAMMGVRFLGASGGGSLFGAQQAIYYVKEMADLYPNKRFIMNCSWGSTSRGAEGDEDDFLLLAFAEAARSGVLTFAAAGNDSVSTTFSEHWPSNYSEVLPEVVSVAATNNMDQLADFSNYSHKSVQVAAPGVLIYSSLPGDQYAAWSGTSMATPHVTGLAAMLWASEPDLSAREVRDRILNTVDILPQLKGYVSSNGRINVRRALENDINVSTMPVAEEIARVVVSPSIPSNGLDKVVKISEEGVKQIQVCFEYIRLNDEWLQVYGRDYRVRDLVQGTYLGYNLVTNESKELCTAPVPGDTAYLRLFASSGDTWSPRVGFKTSSIRVVR